MEKSTEEEGLYSSIEEYEYYSVSGDGTQESAMASDRKPRDLYDDCGIYSEITEIPEMVMKQDENIYMETEDMYPDVGRFGKPVHTDIYEVPRLKEPFCVNLPQASKSVPVMEEDENIYMEIEDLRPKMTSRIQTPYVEDEIYLSNIYINTARRYAKSYGFPCLESLNEHTYRRRPGTANMTGELFEVGIAMFLLLKGIFETAGFELATNVDGIGAFDDLVFKFKDKETLIEYTCLFQLKHKSKKVHRFQSMCLDSGDFSLLKYYDSYCHIKKEFSLTSDNILFSDSFENFTFIIYTNTSFNSRDLHNFNASDKILQKILNSGGPNAHIISFLSDSKAYELFSRLEEYRNILEIITKNNLSYEESKLKLKSFEQLDHCKRLLKIKKHDYAEFRKIVDEQLLEELNIEIWEQFLNKLQLYTQQASEEQLDELVKQNIKLYCKISDEVTQELFSKLKEAMINWWRRGKYALNQNSTIFWQLFMEVHISVLLLPMSVKLLGILLLRFKHTQEIKSKITHVVLKGCTELACLRIQQSLVGVGHILVDSFTMLYHQKEILAVWEYAAWCNVLIIEGDKFDRKIVTEIISVLRSSSDKKLVVVGNTYNAMIKKLYEYQQQFVINSYEDNFRLSELDKDSQDVILESKVIFQGYPTTLKSLANENIIQRTLTADHVIRLLSNNQKLEIGEQMDEIDNCYIPRILIRREYVNETIFSEQKHVQLAITGVSKEELQSLVPSDEITEFAGTINSVGIKSFHYFIINNADDFKSLSKMHDNIHWIEKNKEKFIWRCSKGDIAQIKTYLKDDTIKYNDILDIMSLHSQIILIIAEPGMGKSTELCYVSSKLKQLYPSMWIVKVNLNDHTDYLSQNDLQPNEFLLKAGGFSTDFERFLFTYQVFEGGNIVVMFDGFDEICPNYYDKMIDILRYLSHTKIKNIWITSRYVMREKLEQEFSTLSFSFQHFTENDQKTFLTKFWNVPDNSPYDLSDFISKLLKLSELFDDKLKQFTGIPLQTKMLAEVFQMEALHYSETGENKLPQRLNLLQLYDRFIDEKWDVYYKKLKVDFTKVGLSEDCDERKHMAQQNHMICALIALLDNEKIKQLTKSKTLLKEYEIFIKKFSEGHNKTGIIVDIKNGKPVFVHQTFAEYFLAMLFTENIVSSFSKNRNKNILYNTVRKLFGILELHKFYKKEIFFNFQIARNFFDMILALKYRLHVAVLNQDKASVENLLLEGDDVNERDVGERSPLHLAVTSFQNILEDDESRTNAEQIVLLLLNYGADVNMKDIVMCWRPLRLAVEIKAWSCVILLLERNVEMKDLARIKQNVNDKKYIDGILAEAGKQGSVKLTSFLLNCGVNIEHRFDMGYNSEVTLLHSASKHGKLGLVQFLVGKMANLEARDSGLRRTPLVLAVEEGYANIAEFLIMKGAGVNECDIDGNTASLLAARKGHYNILELLIQYGANFTVCNRYENTALHQASGRGRIECVSLLLKMIPDSAINYRNKLLNTPVMIAARHGQCNVIEVLIKHGADLKVSDKQGNNALHYAAENGSVDCVKLLLDSGLQIDYTNYRNQTTLWCASYLGKLNVTRLLCEYGADLNIQDNVLMDTSLHAAVRNGHIDVVNCLMQYKASFISSNSWRTTPLHIAARFGYVDIAQYLIQSGASLKICIRIGGTPLHMAARWGCLETVDCLLQHGASLTTFDYEGDTPLHIAIKRGHLEVVKHLTKFGANLTLCDHEGHTPLQAAAVNGHLHIMEYLLNLGASLMDCDEKLQTPLHMAAVWGHLHIVEFLIQNGAKTEIYDYEGYTPLHTAVKWGHLNVVSWFIRHGVSLNVCDASGKTALHVAAIWDHLHIVKWLIQYGANLTNNDNEGHTPLHVAIREGKLEVVKLLLQHKESVRPCEEQGHSPLHLATKWGQLDIVKWLIEEGANLTDRDNQGKTSVHVASIDGHLKILMFFFQQGTDVRECDVEGNELLHLAARSGHIQVVEYLIEHGANLTACNKWGNTPLHLAINYCHLHVTKCLIEHGASLKVTDKRGQSPLHIAARWGNLEIINYLMQHEPSLTAKDKEGYTPLHIAVRWGHLHVVKLFKELGAALMTCDYMENSPLLIAATWGHTNIVQWLIENGILTSSNNCCTLLLQEAVKWGHLDIVELCLKFGTSPKTYDEMYKPLHIAAKCGHLEIVKTLVLHGFSLTDYDEMGQMPVHVAIKWAQLHVVEWLVQFGSRLTALDENGFTLVHVASRWGHLHITEWLIKQGASLTVCDKNGNTPLHVAATWGHVHIVRFFVQNNAMLSACDNNGCTPLHLAVKFGHLKIVMCLIESGDNLMILDNEGHTLLHIAAREGNLDIVKYLVSSGANLEVFDKKSCTPLQHALEFMKDSGISEFQRKNISSVVKFLMDLSGNNN